MGYSSELFSLSKKRIPSPFSYPLLQQAAKALANAEEWQRAIKCNEMQVSIQSWKQKLRKLPLKLVLFKLRTQQKQATCSKESC
jgi:hypothetical protein